jgi:hypothetical protein
MDLKEGSCKNVEWGCLSLYKFHGWLFSARDETPAFMRGVQCTEYLKDFQPFKKRF